MPPPRSKGRLDPDDCPLRAKIVDDRVSERQRNPPYGGPLGARVLTEGLRVVIVAWDKAPADTLINRSSSYPRSVGVGDIEMSRGLPAQVDEPVGPVGS